MGMSQTIPAACTFCNAGASLVFHLGARETLASPLCPLTPPPHQTQVASFPETPQLIIAWVLYLFSPNPHLTVVTCFSTQVGLKNKIDQLCVSEESKCVECPSLAISFIHSTDFY